MSLCARCEVAGAAHPTRDPVLVGDVLAGLVDAASFAVRGSGNGSGGGSRGIGWSTGGGGGPGGFSPGGLIPEARSVGSVPDAGRPGASACGRCGARAEWHRTVRGRWIMIEPGELRTATVPAGGRWRVAGDGTAVNLGSAVPSDTCRISHFDVCPARPEPVGSPLLLALWRGHARRIV
ncbi:DUF6083 domain-containing protein [Streptomyces zaomyceticus]|uniref:DUF6083 domain-containing protein n=1 Tax=Streptomyces zaomyceticus TaxID=68286 RepID=UPI00341C012A